MIATRSWGGRTQLEDAVRARLGNECDVLHLTPEEFLRPASERAAVVAEIRSDGVTLVGSAPRARTGAA